MSKYTLVRHVRRLAAFAMLAVLAVIFPSTANAQTEVHVIGPGDHLATIVTLRRGGVRLRPATPFIKLRANRDIPIIAAVHQKTPSILSVALARPTPVLIIFSRTQELGAGRGYQGRLKRGRFRLVRVTKLGVGIELFRNCYQIRPPAPALASDRCTPLL